MTASNPARPGEPILALATGLGYINPALMLIPILAPEVQIGGKTVSAGVAPAPWLPGVTQVSFAVPAGLKAGDSVPLTFLLGTYSSNTAALPVAN